MDHAVDALQAIQEPQVSPDGVWVWDPATSRAASVTRKARRLVKYLPGNRGSMTTSTSSAAQHRPWNVSSNIPGIMSAANSHRDRKKEDDTHGD